MDGSVDPVLMPLDAVLSRVSWLECKTGSTLVDKGGGAGSSLQLVTGASAEAAAAQSSRMFAGKTDRRRREGIFCPSFSFTV